MVHGGILSNRLDVSGNRLRYRAPRPAVLLAAYLSFVWLLAAGGTISEFDHPHSHRATANGLALTIVLIVLSILTARVVRSGTVLADALGMRYTSILRTRRWAWRDVAAVEEITRAVGASAVPRRLVRVHLADGGTRDLTEINESNRCGPGTVGQLVTALESLRRAASGPAGHGTTAGLPGSS